MALPDFVEGVTQACLRDFSRSIRPDENYETTDAALEEIAAAYLEIGDISEESEDVDSLLAAGYAALSNGFWTELMPAFPACTEARFTAFGAGLNLDESVIVASLFYLAEASLGNEEAATVLLESAEACAEILLANLEELEASDEE